MRYADLFEDRHLLDAHILMQEARHFQNLHRQENRLRRPYRQDAQELKELQTQRKKDQEEQAKKAATPHGFELSAPESSQPNGAGNEVTRSKDPRPPNLIMTACAPGPNRTHA